MEDDERKIKCKMPPGGSSMDTLRRLFQGDFSSRMKIDLDTEDCLCSKGGGRASRHRCNGKRKTPKRVRRPALKHPNDSNPFITCSDGDGRDCRHHREPRGCKVGGQSQRGRWSPTFLPQQGKHSGSTPTEVQIPMGRHGRRP